MINFNRRTLRGNILNQVIAAVQGKDISRLDSQLTIATEQYFLEIAEYIRAYQDHFKNNFPESLKHLDESLKLDPSFPAAHFLKSLVLLSMEKYEEAIKCIDYSLQNLTLINFTFLYNNKGVALDRLGRLDEAMFCFLRAIEEDQNNEQAYLNSLTIAIKKKASLEILSISQNIREKFSQRPDLLNANASILLQQVDQSLREGNTNLSAKFLQEADKQLQSAVVLNPENSNILYNLACFYSRSGRLDEALETLNKAFQKAPSDTERNQMQQLARGDVDFENIRKDPRFLQLLNAAA